MLTEPADVPRLPTLAVVWNIFLLIASVLLIMTSIYLIFEYVASSTVEGVQGRYFIPLLPLFIATACSVITARPFRKTSRMGLSVPVPMAIAANLLIADVTMVLAYEVL